MTLRPLQRWQKEDLTPELRLAARGRSSRNRARRCDADLQHRRSFRSRSRLFLCALQLVVLIIGNYYQAPSTRLSPQRGRLGKTVRARPPPPLSQETRQLHASNYYRNYFNISRALRGAMTARASASRGFCARSFVLEPDLHLPRCQSCHVRELNAPIMARVLRPAPRLRRRREEFSVENRVLVDLRRRTLLRPLRPLRPLRRPLGLQHLQARRRTRRCGRCGRRRRHG